MCLKLPCTHHPHKQSNSSEYLLKNKNNTNTNEKVSRISFVHVGLILKSFGDWKCIWMRIYGLKLFSEKNYKHWTCIQIYNIKGIHRPRTYIKFFLLSRYLQVTARASLFGCIRDLTGVSGAQSLLRWCVWGAMRKESSRADGQIRVLFFWCRGWHGKVILFLGAPGGGQGRRALAVVRARPVGSALAFFFVLDAAVLEPNLDLLLGQIEVSCDLYAPKSRKVHVRGELPFQLQELRAGERGAHALAALKLTAVILCWKDKKRERVMMMRVTLKQKSLTKVDFCRRVWHTRLTYGDAVELSWVWNRISGLV